MSSALRWSVRMAIAAGFSFVAASFIVRYELADARPAVLIVLLGMILGLLALILGLWSIRVDGLHRQALGTAMAGLVCLALPLWSVFEGAGKPPIHDVTTNLADPPVFEALVASRPAFANPLDRRQPPDLAAQQRAGYPDLETLWLPTTDEARVFSAALKAASDMGFVVMFRNQQEGRIEAVSTSLLFGFKDDIVIRLRRRIHGVGEQTAVDVRSVSRIGVSDLGVNAERIRAYMEALEARFAE